MKLYKLNFLLILILIVIPFLPYKMPERDRYEYDDLIRLEIECKQWSGGPRVIVGKEDLDRFLDTLPDKSISRDTVNLIGNTPFKSISTFMRGIPSYNEFVVYGEFVEGYSRFNEISFDVKEWYPKNKYIRLYDSMIFYKLKINLILMIIIIILILASLKIKR
ncbi:MAG: hypothetical protein GX889_11565 [Clostridiales bacterium]|nr:hypothetical protein [Clostridiales bacterium]